MKVVSVITGPRVVTLPPVTYDIPAALAQAERDAKEAWGQVWRIVLSRKGAKE